MFGRPLIMFILVPSKGVHLHGERPLLLDGLPQRGGGAKL